MPREPRPRRPEAVPSRSQELRAAGWKTRQEVIGPLGITYVKLDTYLAMLGEAGLFNMAQHTAAVERNAILLSPELADSVTRLRESIEAAPKEGYYDKTQACQYIPCGRGPLLELIMQQPPNPDMGDMLVLRTSQGLEIPHYSAGYLDSLRDLWSVLKQRDRPTGIQPASPIERPFGITHEPLPQSIPDTLKPVDERPVLSDTDKQKILQDVRQLVDELETEARRRSSDRSLQQKINQLQLARAELERTSLEPKGLVALMHSLREQYLENDDD